jgi:hypothetical protein
MEKKANEKYLEFIQNHLRRTMIGPGGEPALVSTNKNIYDPDNALFEKEILSIFPLNVYYSGILFPQRIQIRQQELESTEDEIVADENSKQELNELTGENENINNEISEPEPESESDNQGDDNNIFQIFQHRYYPSTCGLSVQITEENLQDLTIQIAAGKYRKIETEATALPYSMDEKKYIDENFKEIADCFLWHDYKVFKNSNIKKEYFRQLVKKNQFEIKCADAYTCLKQKLLSLYNSFSCFFQRIPVTVSIKLTPEQINDIKIGKLITIDIPECIEVLKDNTHALRLYIQPYESSIAGTYYIKLLLYNSSNIKVQNRIDELCWFQVSMTVETQCFEQFNKIINEKLTAFDPEAKEMAIQYENRKHYAIGHACAVQWEVNSNNKVSAVHTSFYPGIRIHDISNDFREDAPIEIRKITVLRNISYWSNITDNEIIVYLFFFVEEYKKWVSAQAIKAGNHKIKQEIVQRQERIKDRLFAAVQLLKENTEAFFCFKLANTAMFIQMVITQDILRRGHQDQKIDLDWFKQWQPRRIENQKQEIPKEPSYRPFQLAFLLLQIPKIINNTIDHKERNESVDLLWFPTGGGKTEAYLAVTAFTLLWRRLSVNTHLNINSDSHKTKKEADPSAGISVLMRYTLRLLTAQQFERATRLICALEILRRGTLKELQKLGSRPFRIGLWVGSASSPNKVESAKFLIKDLNDKILKGETDPLLYDNPFQLSECPCCGTPAVDITKKYHGFKVNKKGKYIYQCNNDNCPFSGADDKAVPVDVVDESIYNCVPDVLFSTVDKFAMISRAAAAHSLFDSINRSQKPLDLIIQDELHLISGPLGSTVSCYETVIERLYTRDNAAKPVIVASTATPRNAANQIKALFGREVVVFPAPGIDISDSYWAYENSKKKSNRVYNALLISGKTKFTVLKELLGQILVARVLLLRQELLQLADLTEESLQEILNLLDSYWTLLGYFNSLRDIGDTANIISGELDNLLMQLANRFCIGRSLLFLLNNVKTSFKELTSRISGGKIRVTLSQLESQAKITTFLSNIQGKETTNFAIQEVIDLAIATNMISVGLDVSRLNLMLMYGMPRQVTEYIQASSRVARRDPGMVLLLVDGNRSRDLSYFEQFHEFHTSYYRYVEPVSITPFTDVMIERLAAALLIIFTRHYYAIELNANEGACNFREEIADKAFDWIEKRMEARGATDKQKRQLRLQLELVAKEWCGLIKSNPSLSYSSGLKDQNGLLDKDKIIGFIPYSMREVDNLTYYYPDYRDFLDKTNSSDI